MITILYISTTDKASGGEISVLNYVQSLDRTIYCPILLCPKKGMLSELAKRNNIPIIFHTISLLSKKKPWIYLRDLLWLIRLIKKKKIAIIHGMNFYACQIAGPAGYFTNIPVIIHGQNIFDNQKKEVYRNFLFLATKVIVCSKAVGNSLLPTLSKNKLFLLYHAVFIPDRLPQKTFFLHKELNLPKDTKLIGHIGLLEERKCQDIFIAAAKQVSLAHKNVAFLIIGDTLFDTEKYKQKLYALRNELQLQNTVFFLGHREDIHAILAELDIAALPSYNEPLAMVTLEACSFAKPYIGAYTGGTSEIIKDGKNGLLVQPKNVQELSIALSFMLQHSKEATEMGRNAQMTIKEHCNLSKNIIVLSDLYQNLLYQKNHLGK